MFIIYCPKCGRYHCFVIFNLDEYIELKCDYCGYNAIYENKDTQIEVENNE